MKKLLAVLTALLLLLGAAACGGGQKQEGQPRGGEQTQSSGQQAEEKLKVALLLPGPVNDMGWNASAYEGLKEAEKHHGIEGVYRERVSQSEMEEAFRAFATQGFDVIIGHGFEFGDAAQKVAKDFPDVKFVVTSSTISQPPNLASLQVMNIEAGFLGGYLAGLLTKSGVVAYVGGMDIPPIRNAMIGFELGAKMAKPDVEVLKTMTGSFEDVAKAKEQARAFIEQGADVVLGNADQAGLGVIQAAVEKGVIAVGYDHDQSSAAPDTIAGTSIQSYPIAIDYLIKLVKEGKFEPKFYGMGAAEGATGLLWNPQFESKLPAGTKDKVQQVIEDLKSKKLDLEKMAREQGLMN
ncbi:MAG: BMP family protein [Thermoanaerobacteraceae bacterium]|nr:BMP family protein [Thermoanaerobacteraceae bacterium]